MINRYNTNGSALNYLFHFWAASPSGDEPDFSHLMLDRTAPLSTAFLKPLDGKSTSLVLFIANNTENPISVPEFFTPGNTVSLTFPGGETVALPTAPTAQMRIDSGAHKLLKIDLAELLRESEIDELLTAGYTKLAWQLTTPEKSYEAVYYFYKQPPVKKRAAHLRWHSDGLFLTLDKDIMAKYHDRIEVATSVGAVEYLGEQRFRINTGAMEKVFVEIYGTEDSGRTLLFREEFKGVCEQWRISLESAQRRSAAIQQEMSEAKERAAKMLPSLPPEKREIVEEIEDIRAEHLRYRLEKAEKERQILERALQQDEQRLDK